MAFLLFNPDPKRILLIGLGGGSLAKFCYGNLPGASLTAVEVNRDVIALRNEFGIPSDDHRFRVIHADAAAYLSLPAPRSDVILADACDRKGIAADLDSVEFYRMARSRLTPEGVLVANLCGDKESTAAHFSKLQDAFKGELLTLPVQQDSNVIVFGFRKRRPKAYRRQIEAAAANLQRLFQLDFPRFARRITATRRKIAVD
jgi:spermidine synthase